MKFSLPSLPSLPSIPEEIKNIHDFSSALDAAVTVPEPVVNYTLKRLIGQYPEASVTELVKVASQRYRRRVSAESSAVGVGAAVPGVGTVAAAGLTAAEIGTFFAETTLYVLVVTRLYGITVENVDQRKTLVLSSLLGEDADEIMSQRLGLSTLTWARTSLSTMSGAKLGPVNRWLLKKVTKYSAKKGAGRMFGRLLPFGVGAVIGWYSGKHLAAQVIEGLASSLGDAPTQLPTNLRIIEGNAVMNDDDTDNQQLPNDHSVSRPLPVEQD